MLSLQAVNIILSKIPIENKLFFNESLIENLYFNYQNNIIDDENTINELCSLIKGKTVFLIGPGPSIINQKQTILEHIIKYKNHVVISVNSYPSDFPIDYVFISNSKRFNLMYVQLKDHYNKIIATSNIVPITHNFRYIVNYEDYKATNIEENSFTTAINLFMKLGANNLKLAGFDGFSNTNLNYYDGRLTLNENRNMDKFNKEISNYIKSIESKIIIEFITDTRYKIEDQNE